VTARQARRNWLPRSAFIEWAVLSALLSVLAITLGAHS